MVALDVARHALRLDKGGAEEDKRVGWAGDVTRIAFLRVRGLGGGDARRVFLRYELEARGRLSSHVGAGLVRTVRDGSEIGIERIGHHRHCWQGTVDERWHVVCEACATGEVGVRVAKEISGRSRRGVPSSGMSRKASRVNSDIIRCF